MSHEIATVRLRNAWRECQRHIHHAALLNLAIESVDSLEAILARVGQKLEVIVETTQASPAQRLAEHREKPV